MKERCQHYKALKIILGIMNASGINSTIWYLSPPTYWYKSSWSSVDKNLYHLVTYYFMENKQVFVSHTPNPS